MKSVAILTSTGLSCTCMLLPLLVGAALAGDVRAQEAPTDPVSKIYGHWPPLPWDERDVADAGWAASLNGGLDLTRRGRSGESRQYVIRRTNLNLDRLGRVVGSLVAEGRFSRTLIEEVSSGRWAEELEWWSFSIGQAFGRDPVTQLSEVEAARGIRYPFVFGEFDHVNVPGDFGRLGDGLDAHLMKVLAMDATTFDAVLLQLRLELGDSAAIGRVVYGGVWDSAVGISRARGAGDAASYQLGETRAVVAGVTRWGGEPCALIWLSGDGNEVSQDLSGGPLVVRTRATEYFRGSFALSLIDGRIVAGEVWGPLPSRIELGATEETLAEQPIFTVLQEITIREIGE